MTQVSYNPNSALYWFPRIRHGNLPVPRTKFVDIEFMKLINILDGERIPYADEVMGHLDANAVEIGYPVFIRSDHASAKHDGPSAYRAEKKEDLPSVLYQTVEDNAMKDFLPQALMVRSWLDLEAPFKAFGGLPIAREWRLFATKDKVVCSHFYWAEEAIQFWGGRVDEPTFWKRDLAKIAEPLSVDEQVLLKALAMRAATVCTAAPCWSVDFARDREGKWWLIDMAIAQSSWHPEDCPKEREFPAMKGQRGLCALCDKKKVLVMTDLEHRGFCQDCVDEEEGKGVGP